MTKSMKKIAKICGGDIELGNFIFRTKPCAQSFSSDDGGEAARRLLAEIQGFPKDRKKGDCPQDWGRKFLAENGGCVYIDLDHLEICLPEVTSAREHLAAWFAMLEIAEKARQSANQKLPGGEKIEVLVNNSDGLGHSYGSHLNFMVSRDCFDNLMGRRPDIKQYFLSYLVSSIVFSGQGKVGSENGAQTVGFQISQRADFFEAVEGIQTTYRRPLLNTRDEPHAGFSQDGTKPSARLHVIFFDSNLCHVSHFLKVGVTQLILAMLEEDHICNPDLILSDPLGTLRKWSHDPDLMVPGTLLVSKQARTAVEMQKSFWTEVEKFVARGGAEGVVPDARFILRLWQEVLCDLENRNWERLAPRLDWVLKKQILEQALERGAEKKWDSPRIKHLDHLYSSLDPEEGLFWTARKAGIVEELASPEEIARMLSEPPGQTRAFLRAHILRKAGDRVENMDWSWINIRTGESEDKITLLLPRPDYDASLLAKNPTLPELISQLQVRQRKPKGKFNLRRAIKKMRFLTKKLWRLILSKKE